MRYCRVDGGDDTSTPVSTWLPPECLLREIKLTENYRTACMAIALVGDRFRNYDEQIALLNILDKATAKFGWSTIST